ncbi:hypothetical protein G6F37_002892 [Rhizopus arrhizus]|jgi:hypothetical protein|nr:hypothetical protein G6F38_005918 [Rhizopus arrhizus]KAG1161637.1 hypothetical protein G6F37_002892 [Rhizopus arrhizus]
MKEPNFSFPSQNRAAVCITSALYDRRALDCTATLPLVNSLTHLAYLTSTSPRIREILCLDGGLERLVRILYTTSNKMDRLTFWKWSLAFQSVVNVGVRGTEQIRTKVVDVGIVPFILTILDSNINKSSDRKEDNPQIVAEPSSSITHRQPPRRSTFPYVKIDRAQRCHRRIHKGDKKCIEDHTLHREENVLYSLQLLAYLSKYPHIRDLFHTAYEKNVFSVVEKYCHRHQPSPVQYWAGVIMRNACRKDETRGGLRRCANMSCQRWETQPREFAKCRRCRKAKYCSKSCQSKAWAEGHRWWCVERHTVVAGSSSVAASDNTSGTNNEINLPSRNNNNRNSSSISIEQGAEPNAETSDNRAILMELGVHMEL